MTSSSRDPASSRTPWWRRNVFRLAVTAGACALAVYVHAKLNVPPTVTLWPKAQVELQQPLRLDRKKSPPRAALPAALPRDTPRDVDALWRRYAPELFADEPIDGGFRKVHEKLLDRAVEVAREHAFAGAPDSPDVVGEGTTCRSVRCRVTLRSAYAHELGPLSEALENVHAEGAKLFRFYRARDLPPEHDLERKFGREVIVAFHRDHEATVPLSLEPAEPRARPTHEATARNR